MSEQYKGIIVKTSAEFVGWNLESLVKLHQIYNVM